MAVVETLKTVGAQIELENGRDDKGDMKYVKQSLQYVSKGGYSAEAYHAIVAALEPCLNKVIGGMNAIKTYAVSME